MVFDHNGQKYHQDSSIRAENGILMTHLKIIRLRPNSDIKDLSIGNDDGGAKFKRAHNCCVINFTLYPNSRIDKHEWHLILNHIKHEAK